MAKLTKGTHLYIIDPADNSVLRIKRATALNTGGTPAGNIQITDLEETEAHQYAKDLLVPGQATATIQADPEEAGHLRLKALADDLDVGHVTFIIGWGDGTVAPTVDSSGDPVLPTSRTWFEFKGDIMDFPFDFQLGAVVSTQLTIQRSGKGTWTKKAA